MLNSSLKCLAVLAMAIVFSACSSDIVSTSPVDAKTLVTRIETGKAPVVLDVRTPEEYAAGHVPGAINISHDEVADHLDKLPFGKDDEVVVYCGSGRRAGLAEDILRDAGYTGIRDLTGHYNAWKESDRPLEAD